MQHAVEHHSNPYDVWSDYLRRPQSYHLMWDFEAWRQQKQAPAATTPATTYEPMPDELRRAMGR